MLAIAASVLLSGAVFGLTQPVLQSLKVSPRLAALRDALPCEAPRVASLGLREPSLVFTIGTDLAMLNSGAEAVAFLRAILDESTLCKVAFGTEGGLFSQRLGIPVLVCGPGSMEQGHKADEFIALDQLSACDRMMDRLLDRLAA